MKKGGFHNFHCSDPARRRKARQLPKASRALTHVRPNPVKDDVNSAVDGRPVLFGGWTPPVGSGNDF